MRFIILLLFLGFECFSIASVSAQEPPKKLALLVGVADYFNKRLSDLDYADADVIAVGTELKRLGFEVTLLTEKKATYQKVSAAIEKLIEESSGLESDAIVFMMFSGHGQELTEDRIPFYLPRDAKPYDPAKHKVEGKSEDDLAIEFRLIPLNKLISDINANSNSASNLLVFDACRNDPGSGKSSGVTTKITRNVENGTSILFSATSGQKSWESSEAQHGVMSHFLIEGLQGHARNRRNMITWQNLITHVRESVSYDAGKLAGGSDRLQSPHAIINQNATIVLGTVAKVDYSNADMERLESDAFSNYADAQYNLGLRHLNGEGTKEDLLEAKRWFSKASGQEHMAARTQLGLLLKKTGYVGYETDPKKAVELFESAARSGEALAQLELGKAYRDGKQITKDYKKALEWFLKSANQGNVKAQNQAGIRYSSGQGTDVDKEEANKWYRRAAVSGYSWAQYNLAKNYKSGTGVTKSNSSAYKWFLKAANQDIDGAQLELGHFYRDGKHVRKDYAKALEWYKKSANLGNAEAQNSVGIRYHNGQGTKSDKAEANKWFRKAADKGYAWAQYNLAKNYRDGAGIAKNETEAFKWFLKSAKQGNSEAQNQVGICYEFARGVSKDVRKGFEWYKKAADNGDDWGQHNLGLNYRDGTGVTKNQSKAFEWLKKSANQGNSYAQNQVGLFYANGTGVGKSDYEAFKWFKKSADKGYAAAQYNLGLSYRQGDGVTKNESMAMNWFRKAAKQGYKSAQKMIPVEVGEIAKELSGKDLNGSKMSLSNHRGKLVLIDFWNPG